MECNRDEAIRAKELSEKKFTENDIAGAKKWALKAQKLYPNLDGLSQLIATFDVYVSAQQKKNGVVDWYGVLGVEPSADNETIKKRYHTLALFLHPDKNRSIGAEGAFSLLSEGWNLLSDKAKRIAYDQKQNLTGINLNVPNKGSTSAMPSSQGSFYGSSSNINPNTMSQKSNSPLKSSVPPRPTSRTFWTTCISCKMQFEYFQTYLNRNLLCPNCHQPFLAVEIPNPPIRANDSSILPNRFMREQNSHQHTTSELSHDHTTSENASTHGMPPVRSSGVNLLNACTKSSTDRNVPEQVFSTAQAKGVAMPVFRQSKGSQEVPTSNMRNDAFQMKARHVYEKSGFGLSSGSVRGDKSKKKKWVNEHGKNNAATGIANLVTTDVNLVNECTKSNTDRNAPKQVFSTAQTQDVVLPVFGQSKGSQGIPTSYMRDDVFHMKVRHAYEKADSDLFIGSTIGDKSKKKRWVDEHGKKSTAVGMTNLVATGVNLLNACIKSSTDRNTTEQVFSPAQVKGVAMPVFGQSKGSQGVPTSNMRDDVFQMKARHVYEKSGSGLSIGSAISDKSKKKWVDEHEKNSTVAGMANLVTTGVNLLNASFKNASEQVFSTASAQGVVLPIFGQTKRNQEVPTSDMRENASHMKACHAYEKLGSGLSIGSAMRGDKSKKKRWIDEHKKNITAVGMANLVATGIGLPASRKRVTEAGKANTLNLRTDMPQLKTRDLLMMKGKQTILKKLDGLKLVAVTSDKELKKKKSSAIDSEKADVSKCVESIDNKPAIETSESPFARSNIDPSTEQSDMLTMSVPDPDFHDFDNDRTEDSFEKNQVWAVYDDDDGMPRYYAMIDDVVSRKPFRMRIRWLRSKSNDELAPINWIGSGFYKTSGDFRVGKYEDKKSLNSFSHKVNWTKGRKGVIKIYPKEGDVWALYRNWSSDWNAFTPDEVIQKYDMVEVLSDYDEEKGIIVVPLVKVAGFKTVFYRHPELRKTRTVPREEMFRFSHQVPSYLLSGQEGHNAPSGCMDLDPAAMPLELLQVLTEAQLREMEGATEKAKEDFVMGDVGQSEKGKLVGTAKATDEAVLEVTWKEVGRKSKEDKLGKIGEATNEGATIAEATRKEVEGDSMAEGEETKESYSVVYRRKRQKKQKI
ncbi:uncharacterized protein LOC110820533 [Carica papaya]|uniref:uncharacterized protein LOC110820533 n=1 Tax=Carica papaya TaxID=3649 RepID=UPI000B8D19A5|nr:uncharacterized protein LOC110820533 [Carica papaya]